MTLHPYQQRAVEHVRDHDKCALFMDMGLGKTVTMLEAIKDLPKPVLVVAPLRVAATVWEQEAIKWGYDYTFSRILGTKTARELAAKADADVFLINVENLSKLRYEYDPHWKWPSVILDESSLFKTAGSKRTRAALWISKRASNVVLLSGTPAPNGLEDLYSQIKLLDGGQRLGRNKANFLKTYFYPENPFFEHTKWLPQPGSEVAINFLIDDLCMSMQSEDYLDLPDRIVNDIYVDLPLTAQRDYDELAHEMYVNLGNTEIDAVSAGVLVNKLAQFASGSVYTEDGVTFVHDAKLDALADIIEEAAGQQVLIAYTYIHSRERIHRWFPKAHDVKDAGCIEAWNHGDLQLMTLHPASGGHGLNLQQSGAHIMVWFDLP